MRDKIIGLKKENDSRLARDFIGGIIPDDPGWRVYTLTSLPDGLIIQADDETLYEIGSGWLFEIKEIPEDMIRSVDE